MPMNLKRWLFLPLAIVALVLGGLLAYALLVYKPVPVDPDWAISGDADIPPDAVTVRFTGTSTLLFSDGETQWMVDGWFSRPGPLRLLFGEIGPDLAAIDEGLAANEVTTLAAVFPVHSHFDHAMDAPEVARRTGAMLLGSEATANIGRGWGLPESQIQVVEDRVPLKIGQFVITPIESRHFQFPDPEVRQRALANTEIPEPLVPPASVFDYRLGKAYVLHVVHPRGSFVIVGSAGYKEGDLAGLSADVLFLGVGGLGSQTPEYVETYWQETVATIKPSRLVPIHYDGLTAPITGEFRGPVTAMAFIARGSEKTLSILQRKAAANPQIEFQTLPRYDEVVLFP
jgi:L-ascorbate metabolism protein UlaG (beta-lactamase superfamily)